MMPEVDWSRLFAYEAPVKIETSVGKKCKCGNASCKRAKKIRCVCGCHAENHGIEQRQGMQPLDKALGLESKGIAVTGMPAMGMMRS